MTTRLWELARSWLVPLLGLLVVASGFLPWYGARWLETTIDPPRRFYGTDYLSAWQASTRWTLAIAMSAAAAAVWLLGRLALRRMPLPLRFSLAMVPVAAIAVAIEQLGHRQPPPAALVDGVPRSRVIIDPPSMDFAQFLPQSTRDHLAVMHTKGASIDFRWGFTTGCILFGLLALAMLLPAGHDASPTTPEAPERS